MSGNNIEIAGGICHILTFMRHEGLIFLEITGSRKHESKKEEAPKLRIAIQLNPNEGRADA